MQKEKTKERRTIEKIANWHPYQMALYLAMFGSAALFLFILVAYFATSDFTSDALYFSRYFSFSTAILLLSSYPVSKLSQFFEKEKKGRLLKALVSIMLFGILFVMLQIFGWYDMKKAGLISIMLRHNDFLYVLSGLHFIHLAALIIVTLYFTFFYSRKIADPVKSLILFTNPYQKLKLQLLSQSWFFLHFVWVVIFMCFLIALS